MLHTRETAALVVAASPLLKRGLLLFTVVAAVYATSPVVTNGDSYLSFPTAVSLVHERDLDLDEFDVPAVQNHYGTATDDGHSYESYPWAVSVFFLPAILTVDALHAVGLAPSAKELVLQDRMGLVQMWTASAVTAAAAVLVFLIAHELATGDDRRRRRVATAVALVFAFGTAAWSTASRALWQHGPSMLVLAAVVLLAMRLDRNAGERPSSTKAAVLLGAAMAAAAALRPTNVAVVAPVAVWVVLRRRDALPRVLAGGALVAIAWSAINLASTGELISYYNSPGRRLAMHRDFWNAMAANLVSTARGLLIFSPVVLLAGDGLVIRYRDKKLRLLDVMLAASVPLLLIVVSLSREAWWAGHSFGPRFMSDVLPVLVLLAMPAVDKLPSWRRVRQGVVVAAVAWSVFVNAGGAYLRAAHCWNTDPVDVDFDHNRVWSLTQPQVIEGWRKFVRSPGDALTGDCPPRGSVEAAALPGPVVGR